MSLRSPSTLLRRPTDGQNLFVRTCEAGNAACSREYGGVHSAADPTCEGCGAFLSGLSSREILPSSIARISSRIEIIASQNRSSSAFDSLSVGSIIIVPATGKDTVGAWKP